MSTKASLLAAAQKTLNLAYSPYSHVKIAAAVMDETGRIFSGCNVENASYGATVCAERVAIWKAKSEGAKAIKHILVLSEANPPWTPCGLCRQVMLEFSSLETPVYCLNTSGKELSLKLSDLCPHAFSPENMK